MFHDALLLYLCCVTSCNSMMRSALRCSMPEHMLLCLSFVISLHGMQGKQVQQAVLYQVRVIVQHAVSHSPVAAHAELVQSLTRQRWS